MVVAAKKISDKISLHATVYMGNDKNLGNCSCMSFQAHYFKGIAAGMLTKTGKIGTVGSHPIHEIIRNIYAVAIGARSVNLKATVNVIWINA